ncbi:sigma-70 family RNA polymerase sigma factor [Candidatus Poribacteria bacterium]|nr:sigma-70 family RNA polymerase sigma factor [Candidatus Poribacteria bacterium]
MQDDSLLVEKTLAGDEQAFSQLVERYKGAVYALSLQFTGNYHDAQDRAQEAFLQAYRRLSTLKNRRKFGAWLLQIAANVCKMHARKRLPPFVDIDALELDESSIADKSLRYDEPAFANLELRDLLEKALQSLTPSEQDVYTLYFLDNYTYREIARALNVPMGTVKRRLHEVRKKMQKEILIMTSEHGILKHHVGIEVSANQERTAQKLAVFFKKGTPIPTSHQEIFTTAEDNQGSVDVHVLEGDDENDLSACRSLGRMRFRDFSIGPRGVPQIQVTFEIDQNGILTVFAKEPSDKTLTVDQNVSMQVSVEK